MTHFFFPSRQEMHACAALLRLSRGTCGRYLFDGRVGAKDMVYSGNFVQEQGDVQLSQFSITVWWTMVNFSKESATRADWRLGVDNNHLIYKGNTEY